VDTIPYDTVYLRAAKLPKAETNSLLNLAHTKNTKRVTKKTKNKTEMLRRNGPVIKSVKSVLRAEESLWWARFAHSYCTASLS